MSRKGGDDEAAESAIELTLFTSIIVFAMVREETETAEKLCKDLYGEHYAEAKSATQSEPCLSLKEPIEMISYENDEDK